MNTKTPTKPSKTRQAITWGRFSSDQQKDGDSKDRQDRLNQSTAKRLNISILAEYFDKGVSVKDGATPLFKKTVSELPKGVGIICENFDRISRGHPWRAKAYIADILEAGHFIITSQDGREYNETTIEEIETLLLGDMSSNLARVTNKDRTNRVLEAKGKAVELARQGKAAPFGKWLPAHIKYNPETKEYDLRPERQAVIKKIFTDYANGKGVVSITKELNQSGNPTFRGSGKIGAWQRSTVFTLLRYEGLIGVFNYMGERIINAWQPAISEKLFYKVQSILEGNKTRHGNYTSERVNNILRGVSKCAHCGSTMTVTKDNYIACTGYQVGKCKVKNMVKYKELEYQFAQWFIPEAKEALLGKDESFETVDILSAKKDAINKRIDVTLTLLDDDKQVLPIEKIKSRLTTLQTEKDAIENEIATLKATKANNATLPDTFKQLDQLADGIWDNQEIRKKVSSLVPTLVKRVEIDLSDKLFPSFNCHLINGETINWKYALDNKHSITESAVLKLPKDWKRKK